MSDVKSVCGEKGKEDIAVRLLFKLVSIAVFLIRTYLIWAFIFYFRMYIGEINIRGTTRSY